MTYLPKVTWAVQAKAGLGNHPMSILRSLFCALLRGGAPLSHHGPAAPFGVGAMPPRRLPTPGRAFALCASLLPTETVDPRRPGATGWLPWAWPGVAT